MTRAFSGTDANAGQTTMIGAILAGLMLVVATWREWRWLSVAAAIPAGFAATIAAYRLADIENFVEGAPNATAAWGVWAATIAAVALFVLCLVHALLPTRLRLEPTPQPPAPSAP